MWKYVDLQSAPTWAVNVIFSSRRTPRSLTWFDGYMTTPATLMLSITALHFDRLCVPKTIASVLSGLSASTFTQNQVWSSIIHSSGRRRPATQFEFDTAINSCVLLAYCCCWISCPLAMAATGEIYNENKSGPSTDPLGTPVLHSQIFERALLIWTNSRRSASKDDIHSNAAPIKTRRTSSKSYSKSCLLTTDNNVNLDTIILLTTTPI